MKTTLIFCNRSRSLQIQSSGEIKKSEKALKNRMMTIEELQKYINGVSSDAFQVNKNNVLWFFFNVYGLLYLYRILTD